MFKVILLFYNENIDITMIKLLYLTHDSIVDINIFFIN
jgi:hypothetical protein